MFNKTLFAFGLLTCVACLVQAIPVDQEEADLVLERQSLKNRLKDFKEKFATHDWKLSFYGQAPYMESKRFFVEMYKQGQEYAGKVSFFRNNMKENVKFVTEGDKRFVHGFNDPIVGCRQEENTEIFDLLLYQLVKIIEEGQVSESNLLLPVEEQLQMVMAGERRDMTIHFDPAIEPIRVHTLYFHKETLPGLELSFIKIEFNPTVPSGMFEISDECRQGQMQDRSFFIEALFPMYASGI